MKNFLFLILLLTNITVQSQNTYQQRTVDVFNNIISGIGNNFNRIPKIEFVNTENNPAYFSPKKKTIYIENKVINLFKDNPDYDHIIAYLLSHELAHHYLNHAWMKNVDFAYSSTDAARSATNFLIDQTDGGQRKEDETQADIFAGFYAKISGYDALNFGKMCLKKIYSEYKVPEEIPGYPSLDERIEIIQSNIIKTNELADIFYIGNLALVVGDYTLANNCYNEIWNNNFSSREIFNNLGVTSLLKAISLLDYDKSKYIFPIYIDQNTRADNKLSRSGELTDLIDLLRDAEDYFSKSIEKDEAYLPAKINRLNTEFLLNLMLNKLDKNFYKTLESNNHLDKSRVNDLMVLYKIFSNKKPKYKDIKLGSAISKLNYEIYNGEKDFISKNISIDKYNKIDKEDLFWIKEPSKKYSSLKILVKEYKNYKLINYQKDKYIFRITDQIYLKEISKIAENLQISKVFDLNSKIYKTIDSNQLVFEYDSNDKLISVIQY